MVLAPGVRLGPYEVISLIGEGGMGKVWRAHHTGLRRDDALKVLPDDLADDPQRLGRFRREAQVLASLNHPNIAHVYGLEQADGVQALVMELVEGPTLADRIARGPMRVDEALTVARQIAAALQAAHEQGIIHRDLKPANIKVRADGTVKVLDFGLAKVLEPARGGRDFSRAGSRDAAYTQSPTITSPAMMTGVGVLLGTAAYMSPEQARGKPADKRSDIWSFGCVLYEMLTGRRTFDASDISDLFVAILRDEPAWEVLPATLPPAIRALLKQCLAKDHRQRIGDIAAALFVLDESGEGTLSALDQRAQPTHIIGGSDQRRWWQAAAIGAGALLLAGLTGGGVWLTTRPAPGRVERFSIAAAGPTALAITGTARDLAITPDGSRIVYTGRGGSQLFVRAIDQLEPAPLAAAGNGFRDPFVSADGQWVGYVDNTTVLKRVAITGGPALTVTIMNGASRGATFGPDDTIIFAGLDTTTGLQRVSAGGGNVTVLTRPDRARGEFDHFWPEMLPDGRGVLFTVAALNGGLDTAQIALLDLVTGTQRVLVRGGSHAHYVPSGHLVYAAGGALFAIGFDLDRLQTYGTPVPVLPRIVTTPNGGGDFAMAGDGTLVYADAPGAASLATRTLIWVDRMGREEAIPAPPRAYVFPRLSPDGTRVALYIADQQIDNWIWDFTRQTLTRLTFDPGIDQAPVWTPDGQWVIFSSQQGGSVNIHRQAAGGTGQSEQLTHSANVQIPTAVSPDAMRAIFYEVNPKTARDLMSLALDGSHQVKPLLQTPFDEYHAALSPDGRWMAYESNSSGQLEIHVRSFPDVSKGQWQITASGGTRPRWGRTGNELFYFAPDSALMRVPVEAIGATWRSGTATKVLEPRYFTGAANLGGTSYDISPDGRRFLMIKEADSAQGLVPPQIVIVKNWIEDLKRLVPTR